MRLSSSKLCYLALAASLVWSCAGARSSGNGGTGSTGGGARGGNIGTGGHAGSIGAGNFAGTWTPAEFPVTDPSIGTPPDLTGLPEDTAAAPEMIYPLDGSMHPKSIRQITFHWKQGNTSYNTFRIRLDGNGKQLDFFVPCCSANHPNCAPQCQYQMDEVAWLTAAHLMSTSPPSQITVTITGTNGSKVGTSAPKSIYFTPEALMGGLYYWSTALPGIYRMNIQSNKAEPFVAGKSGTTAIGSPGTESNPLNCAGCHTVSRDGSTMAWTANSDCESFGQLAVADTSDPENKFVAPNGTINATLPALSADGSWAAVTYDKPNTVRGDIYSVRNPKVFALWNMVRDGDGKRNPSVAKEYVSGSAESNTLFGANKFPTYPEWSPLWDATANKGQIAVTITQNGTEPGNYGAATVLTGDVTVLDFDNGAITGSTTLVKGTTSEYHVFPTWSPDGNWLAFVTFTVGSPPSSGTMDYYKSAGNPNGILRLVQVSNPARVYKLTAATQMAGTIGPSATWPKFSPFSMSNGDIMFLTFSSKHDYGWALQQQNKTAGQCLMGSPPKSCPGDSTCQIPQLWMAGISLQKAQSTNDPSFAPLWLPYQDTNQWNHLAYWSESITCVANAPSPDLTCGENLTCIDNKCVSTLPIP